MFKEYYAFYSEKTGKYTEEIREATEDNGEGADYDHMAREYMGFSSTSMTGARIQLRDFMTRKVDSILDVIDDIPIENRITYTLVYNLEEKTLSESIMEATWVSGKFHSVTETNISVDYPIIIVLSPHSFEDAKNTLREYFAEETQLWNEHFQKVNELIGSA